MWPYQKKNHVMFKFLTDRARLKASREYSLRRLIVGLGGACAILIVGVIALLPSRIISNSRMNESTVQIEALKSSRLTQDSHSLVVWLDELNQKLAVLSPVDNKSEPYEVFTNMINAKPAGISLRSFFFKTDNKVISVSVSGVAKDRNSLLDFENSLNNSGNFSKVVLPISSFAKDKDIDFDLSLSPKK